MASVEGRALQMAVNAVRPGAEDVLLHNQVIHQVVLLFVMLQNASETASTYMDKVWGEKLLESIHKLSPFRGKRRIR